MFCSVFGSPPVADENTMGRGGSCCCCVFLGLDGIDHLGLGGALRRAWTLFRCGIHTWHHGRYVVIMALPLGGVVLVVSFYFKFFY